MSPVNLPTDYRDFLSNLCNLWIGLYLVQCLIQIGNNIVRVFDSDRNADKTISNAEPFTFGLVDRSVSHRRGVRDQCLNTTQTFRERAKLNRLEHDSRCRKRTDVKRYHTAKPMLLSSRQSMLRMRR